MTIPFLAFDKTSVRTIDIDGRLHVETSPISKATVNPYYGREIPGFEELGLSPDTVYQLLRCPIELAKAAPTFNNIPLLSTHIQVSADEPQLDTVCGSTGTDAEFDGTYLKNSLVIWVADDIKAIQNGQKRELSSAYRYAPVLESGVFEGQKYDLKMTNIIGNHVALVEVGRAGSDVVVQDEALKPPIKTPHNLPIGGKMKPKEKLAAIGALLALDAALDVEKMKAILAMDEDEEENETAKDEEEEKNETAKDEESEEDDKGEKVTKTAMDAAIAIATKSAADQARKQTIALFEAKELVKPLVGDVIAKDSAEEVFKFALSKSGIATDCHPSAYKALVQMAISSKQHTAPVTTLGMDSATVATFPNLSRIKRG